MNNDYHFVTRWRVEGTCGEVADVLADGAALARWWPSVYLHVEQLEPPRADGRGRRVRVVTRGWLPYTLRWEFVVVESQYPFGLTIEASGDFEGRGTWTFAQDGRFVDITYDWRIRAEKPLIRALSFLLKPIFGANHRWAMARGEESLELELARRRASSDAGLAAIPPPLGGGTYAGAALLVGAAAVVVGFVYLAARLRRNRSVRVL